MEGARGNEEDVVGLDRAVLGRDRGALDQRQQVALYALAGNIAADAAVADADLVDLVQEHDAVVLDRVDRFLRQLLTVEQLVGFLVDQDLVRALDRQPPRLGAAAELAEDIADGDRAHLCARHARNLEHRKAAAAGLRLDLDFLVVELAGAELAAKRVARRRAGIGADQRVQHALFRGELGARLHVLALPLAHLDDRDLDEVTDDLLDVAADIADFRELGRLDLDEGRARELGQPPGDFSLADAGRSDHQDVLRQHLLARPPLSCCRRQRLRNAIETARLASAWPTMKRSSSETISRGEKCVMISRYVESWEEQAGQIMGGPACQWRMASKGWSSMMTLRVKLSRICSPTSTSNKSASATVNAIGSLRASRKPA